MIQFPRRPTVSLHLPLTLANESLAQPLIDFRLSSPRGTLGSTTADFVFRRPGILSPDPVEIDTGKRKRVCTQF